MLARMINSTTAGGIHMEKLTLAGSNLTVSPLCMGTANFGSKISEEQSFAHMDRYAELGGNFLDTAHVYSD
jgi:aryl-alcohol dehydrogenase-like predicted oxidoreductase